MTALKNQAIQTALIGNWEEAIAINHEILSENPDDIDALNRLAFAFGSIGDVKKAKNVYQKVLSLDMHNPIATRNLKRLNGSIPGKLTSAPLSTSNLFIEEPGKTKVIELINVTDKKTLSHLRSGEKTDLSVKRMKIFLLSEGKEYIGMLPDDISKRLIKFIALGNRYEAYIKSPDNNKVVVFVRETKRVSRLKNQPSFISSEKSRLTFKPIHDSKDHATSSEEEESL